MGVEGTALARWVFSLQAPMQQCACRQAALCMGDSMGDSMGFQSVMLDVLQRPTSRAMRRKLALLSLGCAPPETLDSTKLGDEPGSTGTSGRSRPWRLESHIWHSRRMRMEPRWVVQMRMEPR